MAVTSNGWSGSEYLKDGVSFTVRNSNISDQVTSMTFKLFILAQSGTHNFNIYCSSHGGNTDFTTGTTGGYCYVTTTNGFSGSSTTVTFTEGNTPQNIYCVVQSIELYNYEVITEYDNTIEYYLGSSYYTSDTETSFDTVSSFTLIDVPDDETYTGTYVNAFTITGKANTGVNDTSCTAQSRTDTTYSYNGWYQGSTSGTYRTPGRTYNLSDGTRLYATISTSSSVYYRYNTLAYLPKPTKNSSITTYKVTFDPNGGSVSTTNKTATKTIPYTFSHWSSTASGGTTYSDSTAFTSAKTVYAQWIAGTPSTTTVTNFPTPTRGQTSSSRIITFDANGGSCSTTTATSTNTTSYTFKGWYSATSGGTKYTQITPTSNTTLHAQWTLSSTGYNAITLPTPTRTDYTFNGWQDSSGNIYAAGASYTPSATTTLTATWSGQTYQVKYNGNSHTSGSMSNSTHTINVVSNLSSNSYKKEYTLSFDAGYTDSSNEAIDDIKVSYAFQGWYSNVNGTGDAITQANNLTTAGNTYNVYAKWLQNSFTLPTPVRSDYSFLGWFDDSGNLITSNSTITSNLTLTAQWSEANANKIIIYTNNDWKKAIALIYKNNTWQEYNFNI